MAGARELGQFADDWGIDIHFIVRVSKSDVVRHCSTDLEAENDSEDVAFYGSPGVRSRCAVGRTFLNIVRSHYATGRNQQSDVG
jgi:hypothetical protein